jgi:hypothetical protein
MSGDRCLNGMRECGVTEPHRHRCAQDGAGRMGRCQYDATHKGPHWFEGSPSPPPFYIPPTVPWHADLRDLSRWPFDMLVDELIANAVDLGASHAQGGVISLVERVAKFRREVIVRAGPQVTP